MTLFKDRKRIEYLFNDVQSAWNELLVNVTLEMADHSSKQAKIASGNIAKIALAAGHPDWEILDQSQAEQFCVQGDKFLFGYGVKQSYETAFKRYLAAAKFGYSEAANMVATMFENGLGREPDLPSAIYWYREAGNKGHADACNHLGRLYETGKGVQLDLAKATEWYIQA
ncbi:Tetratricopeptide-like helical domain-containing protein, partial [Rozella allomycis CSF55]